MDPISIVGLVDASLDLALKCASAVKKMNDIASKYKHSELTLRSIAHNLDTMQFAWDRIGAWIQLYTPDENTDDDGFVLRMARFLETGTLVMDALEKELLPFSDETLGPTPKERGKLIQNSDRQFKKSDESAYSIVPSRMSILTRQTDGQESIRSEEDIVYRRLSFEDDLFTARVYKRNYRNPILLRLFKTKSRKSSETLDPQERTRHAHIERSHDDSPDDVTSRGQEHMHGRNLQGPHLPSTAQDAHQREEELNTLEITSKLASNPAHECETAFEDAEDNETSDPRSTRLAEPPVTPRSVPATERSIRILINACEQGDVAVLKTFLDMGHDVHSQQAYPDITAIHAATMFGHIEIVRVLLQHGISIENETSIGSRPLHLAAQSGDARMIRFLLRYGAQIGPEDYLGEQPIHLAVESGSIEAVRYLVGEGATLDCADLAGHTPLYVATNEHQHDISTLLIKSGARYLMLNREETLRLHVHDSTHDMLYRFSAPPFLETRIEENRYEKAFVQKILKALEDLIASGIPVRMVRYDHQFEDDDDDDISQFLRMSNRIHLLLDRDPRTRQGVQEVIGQFNRIQRRPSTPLLPEDTTGPWLLED